MVVVSFPLGPGAFEFSVELANLWDSFAFVLEAAAGTILQAEIDGPGDGMLLLGVGPVRPAPGGE